MRTAAMLVMVTVFACTVSAQWRYRDPTAPRTAAGTVDVKAPPPRTPAGTVDLSGLWQTDVKYNFNLAADLKPGDVVIDRKSTRLNSSHSQISYAVFCLKKKKRNK